MRWFAAIAALAVACDGGRVHSERSSSNPGAAAVEVEEKTEPDAIPFLEADAEIVLPEVLSERAWWSNETIVIFLNVSTNNACDIVGVTVHDVHPRPSNLADDLARFLVEEVRAEQLSGMARSTNCGVTELRRVTFDFSMQREYGAEPN